MSRILYVGTDRTMTEMTGRLLKRNGFDVQCAVGQRSAPFPVEDRRSARQRRPRPVPLRTARMMIAGLAGGATDWPGSVGRKR